MLENRESVLIPTLYTANLHIFMPYHSARSWLHRMPGSTCKATYPRQRPTDMSKPARGVYIQRYPVIRIETRQIYVGVCYLVISYCRPKLLIHTVTDTTGAGNHLLYWVTRFRKRCGLRWLWTILVVHES
jgi:hypothetical protein